MTHTHSDEKTDKTHRGRTGRTAMLNLAANCFGCMLTKIFRFVWLILHVCWQGRDISLQNELRVLTLRLVTSLMEAKRVDYLGLLVLNWRSHRHLCSCTTANGVTEACDTPSASLGLPLTRSKTKHSSLT